MTAAHAFAAAEPRHLRGGAGRAAQRVRPRRPQRRALQQVEIPERVYRGSHYSDVFVKAWAKAAALDVDTNEEHCNASVRQMARFCGLSVRDFERALTEGRTPGPDGGPPEFVTQRMTRATGIGRTAIREVRPVRDGERFVTVSVAMCDALDPRRLRAALLMAHAAKYHPGYEPTAAELAGELFHHQGESAGQPLSERTARRIVRDLEASGWASVGHRTGYQGRNTVTVNPHPLRPATPAAPAAPAPDEPVQLELELGFGPMPGPDTSPDAETEAAAVAVSEAPGADNHGGSGPDADGGSLAIKEDQQAVTDESCAPKEVGGSRRRRVTGSKPATDAHDLADGTFGPGTSRAPRGTRPAPQPSGKPPYTGPELSWTRRIHTSLAPVRHLLDDANRFVLRKAAREIGHQLDQAATTLMTPERMAARIGARYRDAGPIRDVAAWLLEVGIRHQGCGLPLCESGRVWPTGEPCEACALNRQATREHWRQARAWDDRLAELRARRTAGGLVHEQQPHGQLTAAAMPMPSRSAPPVPFRHAAKEAPMPDDYMPADFRAATGRHLVTGALAIACPTPGCLAEEGQPCTTPRGRRRTTPHTARTTAAEPPGGTHV
ncbi:zinc finger domain-containing protein [Streptomyces sp. NPDC002845]